MADAEQTPNTNIVFRGIDGNECEAFIIAIRDLAFAKGKEEDCHWMLHYATTRLRHKALRWHAKLDPSIRKDWDLFVQALFEEYPLIQEGAIATPVWTSTTFSPAPSTIALPGNECHLPTPQSVRNEVAPHGQVQSSDSLPPGGEVVSSMRVYDPSLPGYKMGRLRVIYEERRQGFYYISTSKRVTLNIREALIVTFTPSSEPHYIGCFDCGEPKLCVELYGPDRSELPRLAGDSRSDQIICMEGDGCQYISNIWGISPDGTLNAALPVLVKKPRPYYNGTWYYPSEYYSTTAVYVDISGTSISFAKNLDLNTPKATSTYLGLPVVPARIVFEPL